MLSVSVQARSCEVEDELRDHFESKLHALEKVWPRLEEAQVKMTRERGQHIAEITLISAGLLTRAQEREHDQRSAFDAALHKLQAQIKRHKDKLQHRARRQNNRDDVNGVVLHPIPAPDLAAPATVAALSNSTNGSRMGQEEEKPLADDDEIDMLHGEAPATMVRVKRFALKPMSPDEAALQMDLLGHDFFVFRNASDHSVGVVYRRSGGGYGLIEPVPD